MSRLFHATSRGNLKGISEQGLLPAIPTIPKKKSKGVYLSEAQFGWMEYVTGGGPGVLIEIETNGFEIIKDEHQGDAVSLVGMEHLLDQDYFCTSQIPLSAIKRMSISDPDAPGTFSEVDFDSALEAENDYLIALYRRALTACVEGGHEEEVQWVKEMPKFSEIGRNRFLTEYAWVVINSGMKNQVAEKIFKKFIDSADFNVVRHPNKNEALLEVFGHGVKYYEELLAADDKLEYLQTLPHIGPITKYHLARNLGLNYAKPDRHIVRLAVHYGYANRIQEFCGRIGELVSERVGVVDVVLWRYCNLTGAKE